MRHSPIHIQDSITIQCIQRRHFDDAIELSEKVLNVEQRYGTRKSFQLKMRIKSSPKYSVVLLDKNTIIGGYFFNEESNLLHEFGLTREKLNWAEKNIKTVKKSKRNMIQSLLEGLQNHQGKGIEGVALYLDKNYRNRGLGRRLINYPYRYLSSEFSYIWGGQEKDLHNLFDWLKRRELIYDTGRCFYTIGSLRT